MKKIYMLSIALFLGVNVEAQNDLSVALNDYTADEATSADPLDLVFTITNEGPDVPIGDTIFFGFFTTADNYAIDLTAGSITYIKLTAIFPTGTSIDLSALTTPPSTMDMDWIYGEIGLNGFVCAYAGVGIGSAYLWPANDADYTDNEMCVDYTVTEVAGLFANQYSVISVYPNPAIDAVNFQVGNNEIDLIKVYDITGREVASVQVNNSLETINTENFEAGVYFYQMINDSEVVKSDKFTVAK